MKLPKAAAANDVGIPKHLGKADFSIFTHQAGAVLPISWSALRSQGRPYEKHSQALGHQAGAGQSLQRR